MASDRRSEAGRPAVLSPWFPEQDPVRLAAIGKFLEETGEGIAILARCLIQGIEGVEPETQIPNKLAAEKEVADICATMEVLMRVFDLDRPAIEHRARLKVAHLTAWHGLIRAQLQPDAYCGKHGRPLLPCEERGGLSAHCDQCEPPDPTDADMFRKG